MTSGTLLAGRYRLVRPIDRGGMGQVWAGVDTVLQRDVAVKVMQVGTDDPVAAGRFRTEAQATAALSHPNVVTIFDLGVDGTVAFLVMELLPGPTLATLVTDLGPLPVFESLLLAEQVAAGLSAAHQAGVVHRDVKPSNLMLDADNRLKLVDFGIARLAHSTSAGLTAANTLVGSAHYLSPEQAEGSPVGPRTDLYALGCVLMTLLTGEPPFGGEHPLSVLHQHLNEDPPRLSSRRADTSPELDALVGELLARDPAYRPATAGEVQARLYSLRRGAAQVPAAALAAPTAVLDAPSRGRSGEQGTGPTLTLSRSQLRHRPRGPRRPTALFVGLAAVALLALLALGLGTRFVAQAPGSAANEAGNTSTQSPTTASPAATTPTTPDTATTTPTVREALADVRRAVIAAQTSGALTPSKAKDVLDRLDGLRQHLAEGDSADAGKRVRELDRQLRRAVASGDLTPAGLQGIEGPLSTLRSVLPPQDSQD